MRKTYVMRLPTLGWSAFAQDGHEHVRRKSRALGNDRKALLGQRESLGNDCVQGLQNVQNLQFHLFVDRQNDRIGTS